MAIDREELLGIAHAERQRLGRMIQFAEPDSWDQPSADPGWWNRDVMAHLMAGDTAAAQLMAREPAEELEEYRAQLGEEPLHRRRVERLYRQPPLRARDTDDPRHLGRGRGIVPRLRRQARR